MSPEMDLQREIIRSVNAEIGDAENPKDRAMLPLRRILVAVDWSKAANSAFRVAASLAHDYGAQLDILHVVSLAALMYGPPPEDYLCNLRHELESYKPDDPTVAVRHLLAEGDPATAILRTAADGNCDLIVLGTHGRSGVRRLVMGSVAEKVVRDATCMVITIKSDSVAIAGSETWNASIPQEETLLTGDCPMLSIRTILHPTDFSDCSRDAFEVACALARDYGARIVLLCVVEPSLAFGDGSVAIPLTCDFDTFKDLLDKVKPADSSIAVEREVLGGDPAQEILRTVNAKHCDLIVMGTHGRSGLGRLLMGSVAEKVVRHATCPVLTVKPPQTSSKSTKTGEVGAKA